MKIKKVRVRRFLSFGEDWAEIDFEKLGPIINICGENLDYGAGYSNGSGKCFGFNTPVLMYDGTIKMVQDIIVGDFVMGPDSLPRKVLSLGRGKEMLYKIDSKNGDSFIANQSHILALKSSRKSGTSIHQKYKKNNYLCISIQEFLTKSNTFKNLAKGTLSGFVNFNEKNVKINPYILGVWLGDGTSSKSAITNTDKAVIKEIYSEAKKRSLDVYKYSKITYTYSSDIRQKKIPSSIARKCYCLHKDGLSFRKISKQINKRNGSISRWVKEVDKYLNSGGDLNDCIHEDANKQNSFLLDLQYYNLINNKHIPECYKINSKEIRLQVLAGLIDADGSKIGPTGYEITTKSKTLGNDIVFLCRSLGFNTKMVETYKTCQTGNGDLYNRIYIKGDCDQIPVKIKRKKCKKRIINKDHLVNKFDINAIGEDNYYGFQVDKDGLFLLGDFTVVHNSSILDSIVYGIYGKLLKELSHKNANHIYSKKGLEIELWVDNLFIRRTRSPDELILHVDGKEVSAGGIPATQEEINKRLKLSYEGFVNVAMFGQHSFHGFLESTAAEKRKVAENLLGLDDYARYQEIAKGQKKYIVDSIATAETTFGTLSESNRLSGVKIMTLKSQQSQWTLSRSREIEDIKNRLSDIRTEKEIIANSNIAEDQSVKEIARIDETLKEKTDRKNKMATALSDSELKSENLRKSYESASAAVAVFSAKIKESQSICKKRKTDIEQVESSKGQRCPRCLGVVKEENVTLLTKGLHEDFKVSAGELESLQAQLNQKQLELEDLKGKYEKITVVRNKVRKEEMTLKEEINSLIQEKLNYTKSPLSSKVAVLDKEYELLSQRLTKAENELSDGDPFREMILISQSELERYQKEIEEIKTEVEHKKKLLPYYDYWVKGFGDKGIRSFLLEERLPALNSRIAHWLNVLIDNRLKLSFDRDLNETIGRVPDDNKKFVYNSLSGGELRRIDLAISQAFAYVAMMASGSCPSIIALDEIGTNFDRPGMASVYRMICELSKDRQVLIVTHDPDLLEMLQGCDTIMARMQNGRTKLEFITSKR